ncbi:MAG TPA: GNAT family N-acetyltransferase, partial [Micromonosporaceae bacterium]
TERLVVRPWTAGSDDLDRIFDLYSRWEVARWLGASPRVLTDPDQAAGMVDRWTERADPEGKYGIWAIERRDGGPVVGSVLLVPLPDPDQRGEGEVEVGWHLHPDSWGHGYATEAARGAIGKGFSDGLREIYAVVRPDNAPSIAVCRRLGMTGLGRTERWYGIELEAFRIAPEPAHG